MTDPLIRDVVAGIRAPTGSDVAAIRDHIAGAGFNPHASHPPDRRVLGLPWNGGAALSAGDRIPTAELHHLRHVVAQREWPAGTTEDEYVDICATSLGPGERVS